MIYKRLRRAVAVTRNRLRRLFSAEAPPPLTGAERRRLLIERGRRDPSVAVTASVVELPARVSLLSRTFVEPRLLILQLAHIGDFVISLRALQRLREGFPGSRITLVCASWNLDWARRSGLVDEVVTFDFFSRLNADWSGATDDIYARFSSLELGPFEIALDLRHDIDTRPCLNRVKAEVRAGYAAPAEPGHRPLDLTLPPVELLPTPDGAEYSLHAELRLELLAEAVVAAFGARGPHPVLRLVPPAAPAPAPPYAILAVGAGDPIRRWPQDKFIELGRRLVELYDLRIVAVGGAAEGDLVADLVAALPEGRATAAVDLAPSELAAHVAAAALLVGLGSGVSHLAATLGVPTLSLLSGVSPLDVWRPVGPRTVDLTGLTPCSPCILRRIEDCPFGAVCLTSITPEAALRAVAGLIGPPARR